MSEPTIIRVAAQVHGRLLVREALTSPAPLLVGFHGYGQTGEGFLEEICEIPGTSEWHVVAIEALHPFYSKRGAIGASWMTSQDRELAISDNIAYVTGAIDEIGMQLALTQPTVFLGFSQGTAMAYRAAFFSAPNRVGLNKDRLACDGLIALAGDAPSEIEAAAADSTDADSDQNIAIPRVLIGRGTADTWYDAPKLESDIARLARMGSAVKTCVFEGGHEWTDAFRSAAGDFLEKLSGSNSGVFP